MTTNVLLLGVSGIPGRYILPSLLKLKEQQSLDINITVLKRSSSSSTDTNTKDYKIDFLDDYSDTTAFAEKLATVQPKIIVSALNAEPKPTLDNYVVDAVLQYQRNNPPSHSEPIAFINGYTLDLLHPCVAELPSSARQGIQAKIDFAHRLQNLTTGGELVYCTIVNASFLDYCLVKGYSAVDLKNQTTTLVDNDGAVLTGCSLSFVGDAVALVVKYLVLGSEAEKAQVRNRRLRIAEVEYSAESLTASVEKITGKKFEVRHKSVKDMLEEGRTIQYLNWSGKGAAGFSKDGLDFGKEVLERRSLDQICSVAIENGVEAFEGVGR